MKVLFKSLLAVSAAVLLAGCGKKEDPTVPVQGFSLSETSIEVRVEATYQLSAVITPENASNKEVKWKSYNEDIATVDETGLVTGIAVGNATIAATCVANGSMKQCVVAVIPKYDYKDLGAIETANCYIITEPGHYKFEALKGNGFDSVGKVARAAVLWETFGTTDEVKPGDIIDPELSILDNYILFSTPETLKAGNAVIAAYDNADNILWSWHIWVPADEIVAIQYKSGAGCTMDRNLGATTATPGLGTTNGFLYQWGRKDPFPGAPDAMGEESNFSTKTTIEWPERLDYIDANKDKASLEYLTAHPTTRFAKLGNTTFANFDWLYTGTAEADATRWLVEYKTIYDPCPPGWRVPNRHGGVDPHCSIIPNGTATDGTAGITIDHEKGCVVIGSEYCVNGPDYYPLIPYTNNGQTKFNKDLTTGVMYWSAHSQSTGNVMASNIGLVSGKWYPKGTSYKFYYALVRCCKTDTLE